MKKKDSFLDKYFKDYAFYMNISNHLDLSLDREGKTVFYKIKEIINKLVTDDVKQEVCFDEEES